MIPKSVNVRMVKGADGREVIQMRVDLGLLQLKTSGRPDGARPHGFESYYDYVVGEAVHLGDDFALSEDQCNEADREFVQFYHRRNCWLRLRQFRKAVEDADHTLALMDFCRDHSPDENWTISHEQYRPYVLFQRSQAEALAELEDRGHRQPWRRWSGDWSGFAKCSPNTRRRSTTTTTKWSGRLRELRDSLREQFDDESLLRQKLSEAVAAEQYELAARLRDEIAKRSGTGR